MDKSYVCVNYRETHNKKKNIKNFVNTIEIDLLVQRKKNNKVTNKSYVDYWIFTSFAQNSIYILIKKIFFKDLFSIFYLY